MGEWPVLGPQAQHDVERLACPLAGLLAAHAEHGLVGGDGTGRDAEVEPPARDVVEHRRASRQFGGMVEGQQEAARSQPDVPGLRERLGQQQVGRWIGLPRHGVVLADPRLAVAQLVEPADHLQVPLESRAQVALGRMGGHQEQAEIHGASSVRGKGEAGGAPSPRR